MSKSSWPFPTEQMTLPEIDLSDVNYEIDLSSITTMPSASYTYSTASPLSNVTIGTSGSGYNGAWLSSNGTGSTNWTTTAPSNVLDVQGDNADVVINGKSLSKFMETMESRLAILQPDLEKLEHFSALKKAYDHYKALEALCELPKKEDGNT